MLSEFLLGMLIYKARKGYPCLSGYFFTPNRLKNMFALLCCNGIEYFLLLGITPDASSRRVVKFELFFACNVEQRKNYLCCL